MFRMTVQRFAELRPSLLPTKLPSFLSLSRRRRDFVELKNVGSNPGAVYWMDVTFFTLMCCKNCTVCLKRPKINKKEARVGPFKHIFNAETYML